MSYENINDFFKSYIKIDGSSVAGYSSVEKSDLLLKPDKLSYYKKPKNIVFCDVVHKNDSRRFLKHALKFAKLYNYDVKIGAELEFFIFKKNKEGKVDFSDLDNKQYMSFCSERIHKLINNIRHSFNKLGINIEAIHHECGENQYEINFEFNNPLIIADQIVLIKQELIKICELNNCYVTFMPKPLENMAGSGMHTNISLFRDGKNLFEDGGKLSRLGELFSHGILNHIKPITAFTCPLINSYKRINSGFESPNKIIMSKSDRTALIRIPKSSAKNRRIELRSPDISCNPYLVFGSIIYAGIDNIDRQIEYNTNDIKYLPKTLNESLSYLKEDKLLYSIIPSLIDGYVKEKELELKSFYNYITDWELNKYF